jgi:hypothetical protein
MRLPGGRTQLFGAVSVVAAIVVGAALPVVLNVAAPASSLALSRAPVAACSPPGLLVVGGTGGRRLATL